MDIKELEGYNFGTKSKNFSAKSANSENDTTFVQPSIIQKSFASMLDFMIVFFIRMLFAILFGVIWYYVGFKDMIAQSQGNPEMLLKMGFIPQLVSFVILIMFGGGIYFVLSYASKYGTTIGGRIYKIKMICKKTGNPPSVLRSVVRYLLCLVPGILVIIAMLMFIRTQEFSVLFFVLGLISVFWYDLWIIDRKLGGVPDLLCGTILISTKEKKVKKFY